MADSQGFSSLPGSLGSRVSVSSRISAANVSLDPVVIPVLCTHSCRILKKPAISGNSNTHSCRIFAAMKKSGKQNIEKTDLPRNAPPFIIIFLYICIIFLINAGNSQRRPCRISFHKRKSGTESCQACRKIELNRKCGKNSCQGCRILKDSVKSGSAPLFSSRILTGAPREIGKRSC